MTTFSLRKEYIIPVIDSIREQTVKPDEIHLYIDFKSQDFQNDTKEKLIGYGVQIYEELRYNSERPNQVLPDIPCHQPKERSYNKLIHTLRRYREGSRNLESSDVLVITIDDDWRYPSTMIETLLDYHERYPNAIITTKGRKINPDYEYDYWNFHQSLISRPYETLILGFSGVLYQPGLFRESVFDPERLELCPTADDIWWTVQAILSDIPIISTTDSAHDYNDEILIPNNRRLYTENRVTNHLQFQNLVKYCQDKYNVDLLQKIKTGYESSDKFNTNGLEFDFCPGLDYHGSDLFFLGREPIEVMKRLCLSHPQCIGFNTLGFFKFWIGKRNEFTPSKYFKSTDGLYIHRERYQDLANKERIQNPPKYLIFGERVPPLIGQKPIIKHYDCPKNKDMMVILPYFNFGNSYRTVQNLLYVKSTLENSQIPHLVVELAFGENAFSLPLNPTIYQLRTESLMFYKENLLRIGIAQTDKQFTKFCFLDADVLFSDPNWYNILSEMLDDRVGIHCFSNMFNLSPSFELDEMSFSILSQQKKHPGLAWAVQSEWIEKYGLYDYCVIGSGDRVFTYCFGNRRNLLENPGYKYLQKSFGEYVKQDLQREGISAPMTAFHMFHGKMADRQYVSRDQIIMDFLGSRGLEDITELLERRTDGLLEWRAHYRQELNESMKNYFNKRNDDKV